MGKYSRRWGADGGSPQSGRNAESFVEGGKIDFVFVRPVSAWNKIDEVCAAVFDSNVLICTGFRTAKFVSCMFSTVDEQGFGI